MSDIDFDDGVASDAAAETASSSIPISEILHSDRDAGGSDVQPSVSPRDDGESRSARDPAVWLAKETARRQRADERAERLREELDRFENARWGIHDEPAHEQQDDPDLNTSDWPLADKYKKSLAAFESQHGPEKVAEFNQALNRLTPSQQAEINQIVRQTGDPRKAVEYLDNAGLLHRQTSIKDILAGNKPHDPAANAEMNKLQEQTRSLEAREQQLAVAERTHVERGSQTNFAREYGQEAFLSLDATVGTMLQRNHPLAPRLAEIYRSSADPTGSVAVALAEWGMWSLPSAQTPRPAPVFPSNLAGARNVGARSGPVWSGPQPLQDIFDRKRA